jgi:hypothetical protein
MMAASSNDARQQDLIFHETKRENISPNEKTFLQR